jgi:thiol-disulfide isomerase/thioredoxin
VVLICKGGKMGKLMMFYGEECKHCHEMMPLLEKLKSEEGIKVEKIETWHNSANKKKLDVLDAGKCGGVPFFYNEETKKTICGAVPYGQLKIWAVGK